MLDIFYYRFKPIPWILSYNLPMGRLLAIVPLSIFMWLSVMCITMGYFVSCLGGVGVGLFFFLFVL